MAKAATKAKSAPKRKAPTPGTGGQYTRKAGGRKPIRTSISSRALAALIQPECKSVAEMAASMDTDYQVTLAKWTLYANIAAVKVEIEPTGDDPRAKLLADQLKKLWDTHLSEMVEFIAHGRVAFEKLWGFNAEANVNYIPKLQPLPFKQTEMRLVEGTGDFDGINLKYGDDKDKSVTIPAANSWWLALDATAIQPHGKSRYSGAPYVVWKERQQAIRLRKLFIQRLVLMGGVAHVPDELILEDGQELDAFTEMAKAHDERVAGALMVLSNKRDAEGNYDFDITDPPSVLNPAPLDDHIDGLDQEQLQSFCIPPKVVIEGEAVGSFAMVSQQRLILDAVVEHILRQMVRSFQKYVIDKAVAATFGEGSPIKIKAGFKSLLDQPNQVIAQVVESLLTSPALPKILTSGVIDVMQLLEDSRIPLLPGAKEAIEKLLQQALNQAQITQAFQQQQLEQGVPPNQPPVPGEPQDVPEPPPGEPPAEPANFANPHHLPAGPRGGQFTTAHAGKVHALRQNLSAMFTVAPHANLIEHMRRIEPAADNGALVGAKALRAAAGLDKQTFDRVAIEMQRAELLSLHRHDFVSSLTDDEREQLIHDPTADDYGHSGRTLKGTFYVGAAIRKN